MADYGFLTSETAEPRVADVLERKPGLLPPFVHVHPDETVARRDRDACASTTCRSCRC